MDMRVYGTDGSIGGLYNGDRGWRNKEENSGGIYTTEELEENARVMKNKRLLQWAQMRILRKRWD